MTSVQSAVCPQHNYTIINIFRITQLTVAICELRRKLHAGMTPDSLRQDFLDVLGEFKAQEGKNS